MLLKQSQEQAQNEQFEKPTETVQIEKSKNIKQCSIKALLMIIGLIVLINILIAAGKNQPKAQSHVILDDNDIDQKQLMKTEDKEKKYDIEEINDKQITKKQVQQQHLIQQNREDKQEKDENEERKKNSHIKEKNEIAQTEQEKQEEQIVAEKEKKSLKKQKITETNESSKEKKSSNKLKISLNKVELVTIPSISEIKDGQTVYSGNILIDQQLAEIQVKVRTFDSKQQYNKYKIVSEQSDGIGNVLNLNF